MSDNIPDMTAIAKLTEKSQHLSWQYYHSFKAATKLKVKLQENVKILQQECCNLKSDKSVFNEKALAENLKISLSNQIQSAKVAVTELQNQELSIKNQNKQLVERIKRQDIEQDLKWNEYKKKFENLPHYKLFIASKNRQQEIQDSIHNLEHKAVTLREEIAKKEAAIYKADRDCVIEFAKYMVIELPAQTKKHKEKVTSNTRRSFSSLLTFKTLDSLDNMKDWKAKLNQLKRGETVFLVPENTYKVKDNIKETQRKDWTLVDDKEIIDKIMTKSDFKMKLLADILEKNNTNPRAFSAHNCVKGKRPYVDDCKEKGDEKYFKNEGCPTKQVVNILDDIKLDKKDTNILLSKVNINELKETNKISADVQPSTSANAVNTGNEAEGEIIEELDITGSQNLILPPTQYMDICQDKNTKRVSFKMADQPFEGDLAEVTDVEEQEDSSQSETDEDTLAMTNVYKTLLESKNILKGDCLPKQKSNETMTSKFFNTNQSFCDNIKNYEKKDKNNAAQESINNAPLDKNEMEIATNINEHIGASAIPDSAMNVDVPEQDNQGDNTENPLAHNYMDVSSYTVAGEDLDIPRFDSSLFLSPQAEIASRIDEDKGEAGFLTSLRKKHVLSFFGQPSTEISNSDDPKQEASFNFTFGGEDKKVKGGFFSTLQKRKF